VTFLDGVLIEEVANGVHGLKPAIPNRGKGIQE
jgi:hypothetical protein